MNFFAIHRGSDAEAVAQVSDKIKDYRTGFLQLNSTKKFWHRQAKRLMRQADVVVYFVGAEITKNIEWELQTAKSLRKPVYIYDLRGTQKFPEFMTETDAYGVSKLRYDPISLEEMERLKSTGQPSVAQTLCNGGECDKEILLEQYKMMIDTTESAIERRQKVSTTYITICSIFMPIISAMLAGNNKWLILSSIAVSLISIVLCVSWIRTIQSYGTSNSAKFEVIENIEKMLPLSLFKAEWYVRSCRNKKVTSFTDREKTIPRIFIVLDIAFICLAAVLFVLKQLAVIA